MKNEERKTRRQKRENKEWEEGKKERKEVKEKDRHFNKERERRNTGDGKEKMYR